MFDNQNNGVDNDNVGIGCVTVLFWVFWGGGWRNIWSWVVWKRIYLDQFCQKILWEYNVSAQNFIV